MYSTKLANENNIEHKMEGPKTPPCVLLLNGFLGVGKLTIAKALVTHFSSRNTRHRLLDNHLIIDAAHAIRPDRSPSNYTLRKEFRKLALNALKMVEHEHLVIILTGCLVKTDDDLGITKEYDDLARARGVGLVVVNILCGLGRNKERLGSEERREGGKSKLVAGEVLERIREETRLVDGEDVLDVMRTGSSGFYFEVDTTDLDTEGAALKIWEFLRGLY